MDKDDLLATLGALNFGIIPIDGRSIDEALKTLPEEEARRARRKYRKLKRKSNPQWAPNPQVRRMCIQHGMTLVEK